MNLLQRKNILGLFVFFMLTQIQIFSQGVWAPLTYSAPDPNGGVMVLLSDGSVLVKTSSGGTDGVGNVWNKLTPDYDGTYLGGTWTTITPMNDTRLYFSSRLLQDGRLYVAGGEYGTGGTTCEIYDPVTDTWTPVTTGLLPTDQILDANSELLPDGRVLQAIVYSTLGYNGVKIFNPVTNSFSAAPSTLGSPDESSWVLLADSSILYIDIASTTSERYIPTLNQWIADAPLPDNIYDNYTSEMGPGFLLPDGRAFFVGGIHKTAIYTPSGDTSFGTWTTGPDIPLNLGSNDGAGAMMPNGKVIFCAAPENLSATPADQYLPPSYFFEFDYSSNTITQTIAPGGGDSLYIPTYYTNMLVLPDGNILYASQGDLQYYLYTPSGPQLAAGKPTINTVAPANSCTHYKITGTGFNGISEGAGFGDDWQMATNFPIVRLTQGANAYYARTTHWNRTGVAYGNLPDTAFFDLPAGLPAGSFTLEVIANGIHSDAFNFTPCSTVSVSTISDETPLSIYPNPSTEQAYISFWTSTEQEYFIQLVDIMGRIVKQDIGKTVVGKNTRTLQFEGLAKGVYTVLLQTSKKNHTGKVVIK